MTVSDRAEWCPDSLDFGTGANPGTEPGLMDRRVSEIQKRLANRLFDQEMGQVRRRLRVRDERRLSQRNVLSRLWASTPWRKARRLRKRFEDGSIEKWSGWLWGEKAHDAEQALIDVVADERSQRSEVTAAAWALAWWHADRGRYWRSAQFARVAAVAAETEAGIANGDLLEAYCWFMVGHRGLAEAMVDFRTGGAARSPALWAELETRLRDVGLLPSSGHAGHAMQDQSETALVSERRQKEWAELNDSWNDAGRRWQRPEGADAADLAVAATYMAIDEELKGIGDRLEAEARKQLRDLAWPKRIWRIVLAAKSSRRSRKQEQSGLLWEERLWAGFSKSAEQALKEIVADRHTGKKGLAKAAWALACWHAAEGRYLPGAYFARIAGVNLYKNRRVAEAALLEAHCLSISGYQDLASDAIDKIPRDALHETVVRLAQANCLHKFEDAFDPEMDAARLALINSVYEGAGLRPLQKIRPDLALRVDNITCTAGHVDSTEAKVSIIVPMYNSGTSIGFVLDSLRRQTWTNIEVVVVDDCSTDEGPQVVEEMAAVDNRILLVRQDRNLGAYCARNRGLAQATGDFITTHDSNDWSHPSKIELQVRPLLDQPSAIASHSHWARTIGNLFFVGKYRFKHRIIDWNPSSLMFRREALDRLGGWDEVRFSADSEFIRRLMHAYPGRGILSIAENVPLSLAWDRSTSLTKTSESHGRTIYHGPRRVYREASDHWREQLGDADPKIIPGGPRPFPVPKPMLPLREAWEDSDTLFIADFTEGGSPWSLVSAQIKHAVSSSARVAVFHWPKQTSRVRERPRSEVLALSQAGDLRIISPGTQVKTGNVVFVDPDLAVDPIDLFPLLEHRSLWVLVDAFSGTADQRATIDRCISDLTRGRARWVSADDQRYLASLKPIQEVS